MTAEYRRPANVAFVVDQDADGGEAVYLAALPFGALTILRGTGALIWQHAVSTRGADLTEELANRIGVPPEAIHADIEAFVRELVEQRLLEPATEVQSPDDPPVSPAASS